MYYPEYDIIERYPAEQTVGFTSTVAEWGVFSNFARTPMVVEGIEFVSVEQMFHYIRLNSEVERAEYLKVSPGMALKMKAKTFAKRGIERDDWRKISVDVMRFCLNHKYHASETFRKELERSKGKYIIENESNRRKKPDSWGAVYDIETNEFYGKNIMGRLLMELREKGNLEYEEFEKYLRDSRLDNDEPLIADMDYNVDDVETYKLNVGDKYPLPTTAYLQYLEEGGDPELFKHKYYDATIRYITPAGSYILELAISPALIADASFDIMTGKEINEQFPEANLDNDKEYCVIGFEDSPIF